VAGQGEHEAEAIGGGWGLSNGAPAPQIARIRRH
jgi:hypothetical protein